MVHTFCCDGRYLALDVDSGAVHLVDRLGYEVISRLEAGEAPGAVLTALTGRFAKDEVQETLEEVEQLRRAGLLFSQDPALHVQPGPVQPGVIKAMCLHVAHDCNLRCRYCFASTGSFHGQRTLMPVETGKKALDLLVARSGGRKYLEVDFFGGEPMMNFGVVKELVAYGRQMEKAHGKVIRFTITTNAYAMNEEDMDFLNREMENVVLSLDGRQEVHNAMRPTAGGGQSFDRSLRNAKRLVEKRGQQKYYVRGTFTRDNLDFSQDVLALADQGFEQVSVEPVVLTPDSPYSLLPEHLPGILAEYDKLYAKYLERRRNGKWFSFFHFMVDLEGGPCIRKRLSGCGAGNEYIAVTPDGEIYPCHQFVGREGFRMGSVLDASIDEELRARFAANTVLAKEKCASCWARLYCTGGCAANAQLFHGDLSKPYEMECEMEKKRLECAMAVYAQERMDSLDQDEAINK